MSLRGKQPCCGELHSSFQTGDPRRSKLNSVPRLISLYLRFGSLRPILSPRPTPYFYFHSSLLYGEECLNQIDSAWTPPLVG